jgi:hypothetical protein
MNNKELELVGESIWNTYRSMAYLLGEMTDDEAQEAGKMPKSTTYGTAKSKKGHGLPATVTTGTKTQAQLKKEAEKSATQPFVAGKRSKALPRSHPQAVRT